MLKRVMSRFPVVFFVLQYRRTWSGNLSCCVSEKLPVVKRLGIREGGVSRYSAEIFLSDSAKKFPGRTLLCFRKFQVSKTLKVLWIRWGGSITAFH